MATVPGTGTTGSDLNLIGDSNKNILTGNAGNDFLDGKGASDALSGGAGNDLLIYDSLDSKIDGGSGFDTLQFIGTNQRLNLTGNKVVIQMEEFKLSNGGSNSLAFSAADVIRVSDNDKFRLWGDSTDRITFNDSGWSFNGFTSTGFVKFKNGSAGVEAQIGLWINGFSGNASINFGAGADNGVVEDESATTLTATGSIVVTDPNSQNFLTTQITPDAGPLGTLSLGALMVSGAPIPGVSNGSYQYNVPNAATQYLAANEQRIDTFTVTSIDGTSTPLSFIITGVNDAPVRTDSTSQSASVIEIADGDAGENATTFIRTGSFVITDVDLADSLSCWVESPSGHHGTLTVKSISAVDIATGERTVSWEYTVTDASLDKLRNAAFVENNTIHVSDRPQGTAGATVVDVAVQVNLQGANDAVEVLPVRPGIDVIERTVSESASTTGNTTNQTREFQFEARDVDLDDTFTVSPTGTTSSTSPIGTLVDGRTSNYDPETGKRDVLYTFQWQDRQLDFLAQGQTLDQTFLVSVADQQTSEDQTISLHFVGANDAPVRQSSGTITGAVTEITDGAAGELTNMHTLTGSFVVRDVDQIDTLSRWIVNPASPRGTLSVTSISSPNTTTGDRTVNWQYVVADSALDALRAQQSIVENYTIKVSDRVQGTVGATVLDIPVAITLNGANDAPVRNVVNTDVITGSVTELASNHASANSSTFFHTATGSFQVKDVDIGDSLTQQSIVHSAPNNAKYGTLVINSISSADPTSGIRTVSWTYSVSDQALNPLPAGSGPLQTFAIALTDGTASVTQNVTISLTGAADGPTFGGDLSKTVSEFTDGDIQENIGMHTITGIVSATNMPAGSLSVSEVGFPGDLSFGSFSATVSAIDANGNATINWSYTVADCVLDSLSGSGLFDGVQLAITHSANPQITQRVSIALTGAPDNPFGTEVSFFDIPGRDANVSSSDNPTSNGISQIYGLDGNDTLRANLNGPQVLFGGDGNDLLKLDAGGVFAVGGTGDDRFDFNAGAVLVRAWGQQGVDRFDVRDASPNAELWVMDFTLGVDRIETFGPADQYMLTLLHTSATNASSDGYNPYVADGTPYYLLRGPNANNEVMDLHIIGSELPSLDAALLM